MMTGWLRDRRRRKLLAQPFPTDWLAMLEGFDHYRRLAEDRRAHLRDLMSVFIAEKHWEGCAGLEITDEMRVVISAQPCVLILELDHEYYRRVATILVYPSAYKHAGTPSRSGEVADDWSANAGESWSGGPIILAWDAALRGAFAARDGHNLVYHEFAHVLDCLDGWADGIPPLASRERHRVWRLVVDREYHLLRTQADSGRATLLDTYGATSPAEFFAVATECFFERSRELKREHEQLYGLLAAFYRQDPDGASR